MINHPAFTVEPWCLRAADLDLSVLAQGESAFALSNGHVGWRANLDEGEPHGLPGAYLNGVCELRPLPYAEAGYGDPESGLTIVNVTDGKVIRLLVNDEPFDVRYGEPAGTDPRVASVLEAPLHAEDHGCHDARVEMVHGTQHSGLRVAAAMDHVVDGPPGLQMVTESYPDLGRVTLTATVVPGQRLRLVKFVAHGWSGVRSLPGLRGQVGAALTAARQSGWGGLLAEQRSYLDDFWARADVELEGDAELQQAVRFALFHVLQAGARAEGRAIPAKGLTGPGYDGHAFWDTETFVLPVLTYTCPDAAAHALRWRHSTLPMAIERARQLGLEGAAFPWRTIRGEECSGYWPAGTAAFHVGADIADAVVRYVRATGDVAFERAEGMELLVATARLWASLGHHDPQGRFRIDGVTGPDEYSALADNNVYTNLMAQQNLSSAAEVAERYPDRARQLGVEVEELAAWRDAAAAMFVPYDDTLGVHPQAEAFTGHQEWDFAATTASDYPLLLHFPYVDLYRKQVVKQADLVLAMQLRGDAFTPEQMARNFSYYERRTVRDSSLSACTQAVMAAEVGHLDLAYDYLGEATLMDLDDLEHNTRDGLHIASLAGAWIALVAGFGGMREREGVLHFTPRLPPEITRLAFTIAVQRRLLRVEVNPANATYQLIESEPLQICHDGELITVALDEPVTRRTVAVSALEGPVQPQGRAPARRRPGPTAAVPAKPQPAPASSHERTPGPRGRCTGYAPA